MTTRNPAALFAPAAFRTRLTGWWRRLWSPEPTADQEREAPQPVLRWEWIGYGTLLITAATMRLWDLGSRALHHDESLHAFYSWDFAQGNGYAHMPLMHGPFQFEANAVIFSVFGDSDYTSRLLYALFGVMLVAAPFLLRGRLGRSGALIVAGLLTFSPAMLYFSRFARNDIIMALWSLGLVICIWRYLDGGRNRYLYAGSALLALAFATKETTFILVFVLGLYLALALLPGLMAAVGSALRSGPEPSRVMSSLPLAWSGLLTGLRDLRTSRPAALLLILGTLSLPQWSALIAVFQDTPLLSWTDLVLANDGEGGLIGAPSGGARLIATIIVLSLLGLSAYWGSRWRWSVWWRCGLIFYVIWVLLYTTFFFNIDGIGSGMWQALGYWVVQQDVARGGQPWYYYFVISSIYEFLPLVLGFIAVFYYARRGDAFRLFLVSWALATFILYIIASEKMPWLLVNLALPLIVLSGRFLGDMVERVDWRRLVSGGGILLLPGVPLFLFMLWRLAISEDDGAMSIVLALLLLGLAALGVVLARRSGVGNSVAFASLPFALVLLGLTVWTGGVASYRNGDVPVEMIVYTQTSPDIPRIAREIEGGADVDGGRDEVPISVDQTSGFTWPWAWYLRNYKQVDYPSYEGAPLEKAPNSSVLLVHSRHQEQAEEVLRGLFKEGERVKHRWWFPESTYRDVSFGEFLGSFVDRDVWRRVSDYFLHRKGVRDQIGSEDGYVYFSTEFGRGR